MLEPLQRFYKSNKIDTSIIESVTCGEKYVAVLLKDGNLGVCATLMNKVDVKISDLDNFDVNNIEHRIVVNAYYNAFFNNQNQYNIEIDIFDELDFTKYSNVVMIGFFKSLVKKFKKEKIPLHIFDKTDSDSVLTSMQEQIEYIKKADAIVLTSTSILNNTFMDIVDATKPRCDIFMLGPSTIMNKEMLEYRNIKVLFGSVFDNNDYRVIDAIAAGGGTASFIGYMHKVFLL
ncbi:MAG: DUF364 domain-containing protein [Bacteroidota bacterium]|nr:DUF364 domain-containing protein [Bacteroidota bacterium]